MDRFDRINQRPVRLTISVPGFDIGRALKKHQKALSDRKRPNVAAPSSPVADATTSTQQDQTNAVDVQPIELGQANAQDGSDIFTAKPFHMEL